MNIGVIGTGNMGGMLAKSFSAYRDLTVRIINRTLSKARDLQEEVPTLEISRSLDEIFRDSDVLFICTKAADGLEILETFASRLTSRQMVATTISSLPLEKMESLTNAKTAIVIPSITQAVNSGVILVSYGCSFGDEAQDTMDALLRRIAIPFVVRPSQLRVASDLSSCGPAFLSVLLSKWSEAAANTGELSTGEAEFLLSQMLLGLADLLQEGMTLSDIIRKVSVPGGVTESGITSLNRNTRDLFSRLHESTSNHKRSSKIIKFTTA